MSLLIYGYHRTCNFGDILMLDSFLESSRTEGVKVIHTARELSSYNYFVDNGLLLMRVCRRLHLAKLGSAIAYLLSRILRIDAVVLCGGTHIQEYGKSVSTGIEGLYHLMYSFSKIKIPIDLVGIGVNRLDNERNILYALRLLGLGRFISVRDKEAIHNAYEMGFEKDRILSGADLAFSSPRFLPFSRQRSSRKNGKVVLLNIINPRSIKGSQGRLDYFVRVVKALINDGFVIKLFLAESFHDADLIRMFSGIVDDIYMFSGNIEEALQFIGSCQVAIAERYHVLLSCSAMNIPCFTPVYNEKTRNLLNSLGAKHFEISYSNLQNTNEILLRVNDVLNSSVETWYPMFEDLRLESKKMLDGYFQLLR